MTTPTSLWNNYANKCAAALFAMAAFASTGAAEYTTPDSSVEAVVAQTVEDADQESTADVEGSEDADRTESSGSDETAVEVSAFEVPEDAKFFENRTLRSGRDAEVYEQTVQHPVREIADGSLPEGVTVIVKEGEDGLTEHIDVQDSLSGYSKKIIPPVEEVVRVGTGEDVERSPHIEPALLTLWAAEAEEERQAQLAAEAEEEAQREAEEAAEAEAQEAEESTQRASDSSSSNSGSSSSSNSSGSSNSSSSSSDDEYRTSARAGEACGGWGDLIEEYFGSAQYAKACSVMQCESEGNPRAQNPVSTASGLYQFLDTTWVAARGAVGADEYARAKDAPAELQIAAAAAWQQRTSWTQWVCQ